MTMSFEWKPGDPTPEVFDTLAELGWRAVYQGGDWVLREVPKAPVLIGLGGLKGSGKDTFADFLVEDDPERFVKIGMSDALHEIALVLNPWIYLRTTADRLCLYGETWQGCPIFVSYKELTATLGYVEAKTLTGYREFLQTLGTEVGRDMIDPDLWVKMARKKIEALMAEGKSVLLTATRFPNEVELIKELGGTTVWVAGGRTIGQVITNAMAVGIRDAPQDALLARAREAAAPGSLVRESSNGQVAIDPHASENSVDPVMFDYVVANDSTLEVLHSRARDILKSIESRS